MLTSSPRRLATIPLFAIAILIYLFSTSSQRQSTLESTQEISDWTKSPSAKDHASVSHVIAYASPVPNTAAPDTSSTSPDVAPSVPAIASVAHSVAIEQTTIPVAPLTPTVNHTVKHTELGRAAKIPQATMIFADNNPETAAYERALKLHIAHGERCGYTTHVLRQDIVGGAEENGRNIEGHWKSGVFKKPLYLLSLVINELAKPAYERAEWIVWIDGDTIILNPNIRWEHFLPPSDPVFSDIHFIGSQDWNGFNCGVFFMRVSEWSVHMLTDVSAFPRLRNEIKLYGQPDQNAMKHVFRMEGRSDNIVYEPKVWFNAYHNGDKNETEPRDGDLLVHFAGYYGNRTVAMGDWFDRLEREPEKFAVPFQETKVMGEIEEFWARLWEAKNRLQEMTVELKQHNITTVHEASLALLDAIRHFPFDKKRLDDVMQKAENAIAG
ncbi:hypothetical protein P7C71_g1207, partial [Lecanoromycetidae sp. Uapishka_2]